MVGMVRTDGVLPVRWRTTSALGVSSIDYPRKLLIGKGQDPFTSPLVKDIRCSFLFNKKKTAEHSMEIR